MYDFTISAESKAELYRDLLAALDALTAGEPDAIANMANVAALIWQYLPDLNWAGFYRLVGGELVVGPFLGKPACIRIAIGDGVWRHGGGDAPDAIGGGCPRLSRPHRLRCGEPVGTGRANRS